MRMKILLMLKADFKGKIFRFLPSPLPSIEYTSLLLHTIWKNYSHERKEGGNDVKRYFTPCERFTLPISVTEY